MNHLTIASSRADSEAAERVAEHHAIMAGQLGLLARNLVDAAGEGGADHARRSLELWCRDDLVPHVRAEQQLLYPPARDVPECRLLIDAMTDGHQRLLALVDQLGRESDPVRAAATGWALKTMFEAHLAQENEHLLPMLASSAQLSVADLLEAMNESLGDESAEAPVAQGHSCGCGEVDPDELPELDARMVPHAIRHATIFGALAAIGPGEGLVLVAPHDPLPLLAQIEQRSPGAFEVSYLERGPEAWRLSLIHR